MSLNDDHIIGDTGLTAAINEIASLVNDHSDALPLKADLVGGKVPYSQSRAAGIFGKGFRIPKGSLDIAKAAVANSANELVEVVIYGDSTTRGDCSNPATGYSWVTKLRQLLVAAGVTNGGRGIISVNDTSTIAGALETGSGVQSKTSIGGGDSYDLIQGETAKATAAGATITYQGKGTAIRIYYAKNQQCGRFTYSVDGGAALTHDANVAAVPTTIGVNYISGLTEGTHTVTIVNAGGSPTTAPTLPGNYGNGAGSLAAGTYYYVATNNPASGGETAASNAASYTSAGSGNAGIQVSGTVAGTNTVKIYRGTSASGPFGYLKSVNGNGGLINTSDDGTVSPNMAVNPPGTSTAGLDTTKNEMHVPVEFLRTTGVVLHVHGMSGVQSTWLTGVVGTSTQLQVAFGLTQGTSGANPSGADYGMPQATKPTARRPRLAIMHLGINDQQNASGTVPTTTNLTQAIGKFVRLARAAGADPLLIVPHFEWAGGAESYAHWFRQTIVAAAEAHSCAWVDFGTPVGLPGAAGASTYGGNVHLAQAGYDAQAQFLFDNVLNPAVLAGL